MIAQPPTSTTAILRGMRKRCPRCGDGPLFQSVYTLYERCKTCKLVYEPRSGDTWAFMYLSTGFFTGAIVVAMILFRPDNQLAGRIAVGIAATILIVCTLPSRKGIAIALEYLIQRQHTDPYTASRANTHREPDE